MGCVSAGPQGGRQLALLRRGYYRKGKNDRRGEKWKREKGRWKIGSSSAFFHVPFSIFHRPRGARFGTPPR